MKKNVTRRKRSYRKRSPEEQAELSRAVEANKKHSEEEATAEEKRQGEARRDYVETAAKVRRRGRCTA